MASCRSAAAATVMRSSAAEAMAHGASSAASASHPRTRIRFIPPLLLSLCIRRLRESSPTRDPYDSMRPALPHAVAHVHVEQQLQWIAIRPRCQQELEALARGQAQRVLTDGGIGDVDLPGIRLAAETGRLAGGQAQRAGHGERLRKLGARIDGLAREQARQLILSNAHAQVLAFELQFHHVAPGWSASTMVSAQPGCRLATSTILPAGQSPASSGSTTQAPACAKGWIRNGCCWLGTL